MRSTAPFCPPAFASKWARAVPSEFAQQNVTWMRRHAYGYPGRRWLDGRARAVAALEQAGVRLHLVSIGCGSFGCVYPVEGRPDTVCKITGDASEAAAALTVIRSGRRFPHLVAYRCVYGVRGAPMWALLIERLQPLAAGERAFIAESENDYDIACDPAYGAGANATGAAQIIGRARRKLGAQGVQQAQGLIDTVRALHQIDVHFFDLHRANVLRDANGTWKIIDLGVSIAPRQRAPRLGAL